MNKKIIVIIILMILFIILFLFIMSNLVLKNDNFVIKERSDKKDNNKFKVEDEDEDEDDSVSIIDIPKDNSIILGDKNGPIMSQNVIKTIEKSARAKIANFQFSKAEKDITDAIKTYNIKDSSSFKDIEEMYFDLPAMIQLPYLLSYEDNENIARLIKNLKDNENFFVSVMWLERPEREKFIYTGDSINPVFYGNMEIISKNKINIQDILNIEALKNINKRIKNIEEIYEYEFEIENNVLIAYVVKANNSYGVYKIIEKIDDSTNYYTINEWNKILNKEADDSDIFNTLNDYPENENEDEENKVENEEEDKDENGILIIKPDVIKKGE